MLNPHYKNMGNLYGSRVLDLSAAAPRVGVEGAAAIMRHRLPMTARESVALGFYDACPWRAIRHAFLVDVARRAELAVAPDFAGRLRDKQQRRTADEAAKPLAAWRAEELARMRRSFFGFDPSYHRRPLAFRAQVAGLLDAAPPGAPSRSRLEDSRLTG